ncbi:MAG: AMP-binding protein, partial [Ilumatobacter sp.]
MSVSTLEGRTFVADLLQGADGPALVCGDTTVGYDELRDRIEHFVRLLDVAERSLVVVEMERTIEHVIAYLALLDAGHVPLLVGERGVDMVDGWRPSAFVRVGSTGEFEVERYPDSERIELHDDLALLLSTSGTTGSPKLVRLSHENLSSNARAIAEYLGLDESDRGVTTLPLHYCYGLSVLHAHLVVGASVVVTVASVVDPCFRSAIETHRVTNIAGVPHTFELLDRVGSDRIRVPSLRFVTQAGGRLPRRSVTRWAERTKAWGVDFFVMYGQTEATARMAYLPPELASRRPESIGRAIPGGELSIRSSDDDCDQDPDVGELVYRGPNVMLGYAESPADLSLGRTVHELSTGDLARFHADDAVFEIVGRRSRFVKPLGLRIDLDHIEDRLGRDLSGDVAITGDDDRLVVLAPGADADAVTERVRAMTSLPLPMVVVVTDVEIPRTATDKVDYPAISLEARVDGPSCPGESVASAIASVLGRTSIGPDDTFVSLGGDSLSYVECSIRLERVLGTVPTDWHVLPLRDLESLPRPTTPRRWWSATRTDTTVLLRAIAICLVVLTHMRIMFFPGGAHLLLGVVGFNLSRFLLPIPSTGDRIRAGLRTAARAAVPAVAWVAVGMVAFGAYNVGTLLLVNNYVGPPGHRDDLWHFWFIEVFVHVVALATALTAIPAVRRLDGRFAYGLPLAVLAVLLLPRLEWAYMDGWYNLRFRTHGVAWLVALGWLIHRSDTTAKRVGTSAITFVVVIDFFDYLPRELFIACALVVLVWMRDLPIPRPMVSPIGVIASASMWIYITHFTIWPRLAEVMDERLAYIATVAAGV